MPLQAPLLKRLTFILSLTLTGCAYTPSSADQLASTHHWVASDITTTTFTLRSYRPNQKVTSDVLNIYIEGDGFAWSSRTTPSLDPTPKNPIALKLALAANQGNSIYLARPCQYIPTQPLCTNQYWTSSRYANEVVDAMNQAIDKIVQATKVRHINLIGFSGGGTIAALIALRRNDVNKITTISANLDHTAWSKYHKVSPLTGSLNPANYIKQLSTIEQHHFVGANDKNTPPVLLQDFYNKFDHLKHAVHIYTIANFTHNCCWEDEWPALVQKIEITSP